MIIERPTLAALIVAVAALTLSGPGCDRDAPPRDYARRVIQLDDVPKPAMDSARKQLPGVKFDDAWSNVNAKGEVHSYEVRGRATNGKIREVRVSAEGEVLEIE